ncbi:apotyrosinase chaperone MelC1 [Streptomyces sp. TRM49041]|uniref:apotyrosinase chaperone MelC1 n=1 Tax=Streptomyces sp. TRM49041 TaxID=2603216 RepID=UPI0011EBD24C|nr:tyrosinase cofactor [Streptomyces sp. TRM49041]
MSSISRRAALGAAVGAAAGLAAAAPALATALTDQPGPVGEPDWELHGAGGGHGHGTGIPGSAGPGPFDEVYEGRRIQGRPTNGGGHHGGGAHGGYTVHIDGRELHLMRNADGTWISVINHYEQLHSPRAAARTAVLELQGAPLVPLVTT